MVNSIITMDSLKESSIQVHPGMISVSPHFNSETVIDLSDVAPKFPRCYSTNNSTACYITKENEIFVTPFTRKAINTLRAAGFKEKTFYVPFSNGDYPKSQKDKWFKLQLEAKQEWKKEFERDCYEFCDEHNIGTLSQEILENCFEIPSKGVDVKHPFYNSCYYPIITSDCLDCVASQKIGKFSTNNGRVVFVYRNGKTYVTKGYKILKELKASGYTEDSLFVPFSNGEQITSPELRRLWESITR